MRSLVAVTALCLLGLSACGKDEVDIDSVEQAIEDQLKKDAGVNAVVDCPDPVEWETGGEFHCIADAPGSGYQKTTVTVSMENDEGEVTWRVG